MTQFQNNSIFWVEVEKIKPNPYQPRREFDEARLNDLAESIRMYGVLQPLTVTRREFQKGDGGLAVEYELIAGERRWRASKIAGLFQVPVIIRSGPEDAKIKLELAIIENLQREDLNAIDRAKAFQQLAEEFDFTHAEIAKKVGKSREYVSNSIRLLLLPEEMMSAIVECKMSEGHARPLLMLSDRPEEQATLFKEIVYKKITVREAEKIARKIAHDKVRKKDTTVNPKIVSLEKKLSESLGTRVHIEPKDIGGKLIIDFFSDEDLESILDIVNASLLNKNRGVDAMLNKFIKKTKEALTPEDKDAPLEEEVVFEDNESVESEESLVPEEEQGPITDDSEEVQEDDGGIEEVQSKEETGSRENTAPEREQDESTNSENSSKEDDEEELYSISRFTI